MSQRVSSHSHTRKKRKRRKTAERAIEAAQTTQQIPQANHNYSGNYFSGNAAGAFENAFPRNGVVLVKNDNSGLQLPSSSSPQLHYKGKNKNRNRESENLVDQLNNMKK